MGIKLEYVYSDGDSLRTSFGKQFVFDAENYGMEQPETLTLRTSQDMITYLFQHVIIMIYWLNYIYMITKGINQLWRTPHLEHPKTLQHIYIYVYICV